MTRTRRGLILDFGGVLTTSVPVCALAFDRAEGLPEGTFLRAISADPTGRALYADLERGTVSQAQWNKQMGAVLDIDGEDLLRRVLADLRPEPQMIAAAQAARAAGVLVGIFTNSLGLEPYDIYEGYDIHTAYDAVLISEHYRARKPDPELYPVMLDKMGLPGSQCVFVDDTARNLVPFEEFGVAKVLAQDDPAATVAQVEALLGLHLTEQASRSTGRFTGSRSAADPVVSGSGSGRVLWVRSSLMAAPRRSRLRGCAAVPRPRCG